VAKIAAKTEQSDDYGEKNAHPRATGRALYSGVLNKGPNMHG